MLGLPRKNPFPIIRAGFSDRRAPEAKHASPTPEAEGTASLGPIVAEGQNRIELEGSDAEAYATLKRRRADRRRRRRIKRGVIAVIIIAVIGLSTLAVSLLTKPDQAGPKQVTEQVDSGTFISQIDAHGTLEARSSTAISPTIEGTISEVRVTEGQAVNKGDVLMIISNHELDVAVADAKRSLRDAQADLAAAKKAAKQDAGGEGQGGEGQGGTAAAQRAVEAAQAALDQAQSKANERTVSAPAAGRIVNLSAQVGASLSDSAKGASGAGALMQIADLSQMKLTLQIAEEDIAAVAAGQTADITFPAFDGLAAKGSVCGIASAASTDSADSQMNSGSSNGVTFAVDLLIAEPDARLKPGMTAEAKLQTKRLENVVMVPLVALQTHDKSSFVTVQTDAEHSSGEQRKVTVYAKNADVAVIGRIAGSTPGDGEQDMAEAPLKKGDMLVVSGGANDSDASASEGGAAS